MNYAFFYVDISHWMNAVQLLVENINWLIIVVAFEGRLFVTGKLLDLVIWISWCFELVNSSALSFFSTLMFSLFFLSLIAVVVIGADSWCVCWNHWCCFCAISYKCSLNITRKCFQLIVHCASYHSYVKIFSIYIFVDHRDSQKCTNCEKLLTCNTYWQNVRVTIILSINTILLLPAALRGSQRVGI